MFKLWKKKVSKTAKVEATVAVDPMNDTKIIEFEAKSTKDELEQVKAEVKKKQEEVQKAITRKLEKKG